MFSKSKQNDPVPQPAPTLDSHTEYKPAASGSTSHGQKSKATASILAPDLTIIGNVRSSGDIQIEGTIEGDIRAQVMVVGESATVKGEVVAEEIVVHGRVVGRLRGARIRLSATAQVEGDVVHKTIAIESGAHFEGSVHRQEDPLAQKNGAQPARLSGPAPVNGPTPAKVDGAAS